MHVVALAHVLTTNKLYDLHMYTEYEFHLVMLNFCFGNIGENYIKNKIAIVLTTATRWQHLLC